MSKPELSKALRDLTEELVIATEYKEKAELEYELEKARMLFSAEISNLTNQTMREAQVTIFMSNNGMGREIAEARTKAKVAWYKWSAVKTLMEHGQI